MRVLAGVAFVVRRLCLQRDMQQKAASLLASQELLAEEEREQARAAAKKAKKDRAKAKLAASQKPVQILNERPLSPPGSPVQSPSARPLAETENQHKSDELFKSSTSNRDGTVVDKPATSELNFGPSSTSSSKVSTGTTDQAEWYQTGRKGSGRKGSVLPAPVSGIPTMTAELVLVEPGLPTESPGLAAESSGLPAEGSGLATETCSSSSCLGSSAQEQRVLRLMICPLTQVQSLCPFLVGQLWDWHDVSWQKLLTAMSPDWR